MSVQKENRFYEFCKHYLNVFSGFTQWRTGQGVSLPSGKWAPDEVDPLKH
jgi:hypothetical protein